jgi:hypothetical protein
MSQESAEKRSQVRRLVSFVLLFGFVVLLTSGIVLFFSPRGWVARSTGWAFLGLGKWQWKAVHINLAWTLVVVTAVHLILNWRIFLGYFRRATPRGRFWVRDFSIALALVMLLVMGAASGLQPFAFLSGDEIRQGRSWKSRRRADPGWRGGPGRGMGHGRGWGRGQGMGYGQGRGRGQGMGNGQGWGRGQGMGNGQGWGRGRRP